MNKNKPTDEQLAAMSGWQIAEALGCHYTGDGDPIKHGGIFYDARDWAEHGYASCVEFWEDPDEPDLTRITVGVINKQEGLDMGHALECCGLVTEHALWRAKGRDTTHLEVESCRAYSGIEPDAYYDGPQGFDIEATDEADIWGAVRHLIEQLGS